MPLSLQRRRHPRYLVHKIASYHYIGRQFFTLTLDLGLGGMKIKTRYYLPQDEHLDFKLVLGANSIWPRARIAYSRFLDTQMVSGVQFVALSGRDRTRLRKYLASQQERPRTRDTLSPGRDSKTDGHEPVEE